ncbi:hormone-sensitive lipase-like, partial [Ascaphus truei]|uniref:hormone-sensitive lipase-like n=1 Tax=Ascaphus truei TaxID=8439 RepID=UPI003F5A2DEE
DSEQLNVLVKPEGPLSLDLRLRSRPAPLSPELIIHFHGGGFVAQTSKSHEPYLRTWAQELGAPILSVDYSLAPEAPFPRALEECFYAYCWALTHCRLLGSTAERVCLAGDSAGGNLCITVSLRAAAVGIRMPDGIMAAYPATLLQATASPSRLLTLIDPLLPLSVLSKCLSAYAGTERVLVEDPIPEKQSAASQVKRGTALFLRDIRQGATSWLSALMEGGKEKGTVRKSVSEAALVGDSSANYRVSLKSKTYQDLSLHQHSAESGAQDQHSAESGAQNQHSAESGAQNQHSAGSGAQNQHSAGSGAQNQHSAESGAQNQHSAQNHSNPHIQNQPPPLTFSVQSGPGGRETLSPCETQRQEVNFFLPESEPPGHSCEGEPPGHSCEGEPPGHSCEGEPPGHSCEGEPPGHSCEGEPPGHSWEGEPPGHSWEGEPPGHSCEGEPPGHSCEGEPPGHSFEPPSPATSQTLGFPDGFQPLRSQNGAAHMTLQTSAIVHNPYMSPLLAPDSMLQSLPPVHIVACALDPMLDDSVMFAKRLRALSRPVTLRVVEDLPHGFLSLSQLSRETREATAVCVECIRQILREEAPALPAATAPRKHRKLERTLGKIMVTEREIGA